MHIASQRTGFTQNEQASANNSTSDNRFTSTCAVGSDEYLLLWVLHHLDEAIQEGRNEAVESYRRAAEYLVSRQTGLSKAMTIGYRAEGEEACPDNKQLIAA